MSIRKARGSKKNRKRSKATSTVNKVKVKPIDLGNTTELFEAGAEALLGIDEIKRDDKHKKTSSSIDKEKLYRRFRKESEQKGSIYVWITDLHDEFPNLTDDEFMWEMYKLQGDGKAYIVQGRANKEKKTYVYDNLRWSTITLR